MKQLKKKYSLPLIVVLMGLSSEGLAKTSLQSPWDFSSPQRTGTQSVSCPAPVKVPHDLKVGKQYKDNGYGDTLDKNKYNKLKKKTASVTESNNQVIKSADEYQRTGDPQYAKCVAGWLQSLASQGALTGKMTNSQSNFVRTWAITAWSVTWLKVHNSSAITTEQKENISQWLNKLAHESMDYWKKRGSTSGNILYSAGAGATAAGIASGDQALYDWGTGIFDLALDNITEDGYMKPETGRGKKALIYLNTNAANLTTIAELAGANGDNLYAHQNFKFNTYINTLLKTLLDPTALNKIAKKEQPLTHKQYLGWLPMYLRSFPSQVGDEVLKKYHYDKSSTDFRKLGGDPPSAFIHTGVIYSPKSE